ncbi:carbamoyltransferase HypF [Calothrix sp. UHCC 0171]|uniref:carbamoyltransferase HypF n=1 Tax=Calothrix sp. UHCC 0171 TaxID=3110245 RepID=UPI002B1F3F4E|nr:carbamoyltransferase HypF [Calothrix sp. UHCC 0171]MEA5569708.1 carbamoyltransferase HypF [Calothrix sp. UHCC 0171]
MNPNQKRLCITIQGGVQGVGFRPFIYRLAKELKLVGWVKNSAEGVLIEVEGDNHTLEIFRQRIQIEKPQHAFIQSLKFIFLEPVNYTNFEIHRSIDGNKTALIAPDIATCANCLKEIFTPTNYRYHYPFTNCTNCGPRFSIIKALPYDRSRTTMKNFVMCNICHTEYENPRDRRFHAQPNACPQCGPHLQLWNRQGDVLASHDTALQMAADMIRQGEIIAIKGLGGFHFIVDARNNNVIKKLRSRKQRQEKPFALMYPTIELVKEHCEVSEIEEKLLNSSPAPIVLLRYKGWNKAEIPQETVNTNAPAFSVAPANPYLGIMLPYTPLHHLLMAELNFPVVATSGNVSEQPICIRENEAIKQLGNIADKFLIHNRPIYQPVDDSIVRLVMDAPTVLRHARGYAPSAIPINSQSKIIAVGAHLKNTVAISINQQVLLSQHIGDLENIHTVNTFKQVIQNLSQIYDFQPDAVACDLHPNFLSTQLAQQLAQNFNIPLIPVQHHYAHVLSCMAENQINDSVLGIAWDGTGYGLDGTIWGGEFLLIKDISFQRIAHLRNFALPGGEKAIKQPKRAAIALLYEVFGDSLWEMRSLLPIQAFSAPEFRIIQAMLQRDFNSPKTSSCGRLFDAISSILGLCQEITFAGQAAMALEFTINGLKTDESYDFAPIKPTNVHQDLPIIIDWEITIKQLLKDMQTGLSISKISAKFHNTLVEIMIVVAKYVGAKKVVITGGCFQNKYLTERAIQRLRAENFCPYWHQSIPTNDGGIAVGQIVAGCREMEHIAQYQ